MPRYAIIHPFANWEDVLPNGTEETYHEETYIGLDSMNITKEERQVLKKKKQRIYCPVCEEEVFFKSGYTRKIGMSIAIVRKALPMP